MAKLFGTEENVVTATLAALFLHALASRPDVKDLNSEVINTSFALAIRFVGECKERFP